MNILPCVRFFSVLILILSFSKFVMCFGICISFFEYLYIALVLSKVSNISSSYFYYSCQGNIFNFHFLSLKYFIFSSSIFLFYFCFISAFFQLTKNNFNGFTFIITLPGMKTESNMAEMRQLSNCH